MMEDSVILMKQVYTFWLITLCCLIMVDTSQSVESIVSSISSISSNITMDRGRVRGVGNISRVVGMTSGDSIGIGKSIVDLSNGVGISIRISLPLANVAGVQATVSSLSTVSSEVSLVSMDRGRVRSVGNISGVVGMSSGNSISKRKTIVDLGNGVGISICLGLSLRVSLPLANVVSIVGAIGTIGVESIVGSQMTSIAKMSRSQTMTIVHTSDNSGLTIVSCLQGRDASPNLGNGVGISVSISRHSSNGNTSKYKGLHGLLGNLGRLIPM